MLEMRTYIARNADSYSLANARSMAFSVNEDTLEHIPQQPSPPCARGSSVVGQKFLWRLNFFFTLSPPSKFYASLNGAESSIDVEFLYT
jgi:hypothetical protein